MRHPHHPDDCRGSDRTSPHPSTARRRHGRRGRRGATPIYHGEWTTEGEYGVPFERPAQYGTRQFLTDEEYTEAHARTSASATSRTSSPSTCCPAACGRDRADPALARIQHHVAAHLAHDRSAGRPASAAHRRRQAGPFRAAVRQPARRRTVRLRTTTTASASAASSTAEAFPTRCSRRSTTPTCGSCRARATSPSPTS